MIKHEPNTNIEDLVEYYTKKDGVAIKYVCTTDINNSYDSPADIFYRKTPHPEYGNRYFAIRVKNGKVYISDADEMEDLIFGMVYDDENNLRYSQCHHDFKMFKNGNMIDGGRSYIRSSGQVCIFVVRDGEMVVNEE